MKDKKKKEGYDKEAREKIFTFRGTWFKKKNTNLISLVVESSSFSFLYFIFYFLFIYF